MRPWSVPDTAACQGLLRGCSRKDPCKMPKLKHLKLQGAEDSLPESAVAHCLVVADHVRNQLPRQPLVR